MILDLKIRSEETPQLSRLIADALSSPVEFGDGYCSRCLQQRNTKTVVSSAPDVLFVFVDVPKDGAVHNIDLNGQVTVGTKHYEVLGFLNCNQEESAVAFMKLPSSLFWTRFQGRMADPVLNQEDPKASGPCIVVFQDN
jgi:hypothetical protein